MAHNINYNQQTGKHSFFSVKEKAWHNLGQIMEDYPTSAEAIKHAGLDYHVEKRPLFTYDSENYKGETKTDIVIPEIEVPDFFATVRTDTEQVFGVVGNDYNVVQNVDAFSFFDSIVGGRNEILYETAGALGKAGERIFITAKLSSTFNNIVSSVMEYSFANQTQQEATTKGTLYGCYNAVSGYFQNVRNYRHEESKLKSIMFGAGLQRSQTALNLCGEFAKHGNLALN